MKLAEALILRADHQKRIAQLKQRIVNSAKVQEGENPAEDPRPLLNQLNETADALLKLIQEINATNAATELDQGMTVSDAIAVRDVLRARHTIYRDLAQAATVTQERMLRSEIKFKSTLGVADLQRQADEFARQHRELDARIQEVNWLTDLRER
jgi:Family of unknown function (DUF6847)